MRAESGRGGIGLRWNGSWEPGTPLLGRFLFSVGLLAVVFGGVGLVAGERPLAGVLLLPVGLAVLAAAVVVLRRR